MSNAADCLLPAAEPAAFPPAGDFRTERRLMDGGHSAAFLPERRGADAAAALD